MSAARDASLLELALSQHAAFSRAQARELGYTDSQIEYKREQELWLPKQGKVFTLPQFEETFQQQAMVAHLHAGHGSFLSFWCGAMLRGLEGVFKADIEITVNRKMRRIPDVKVHYAQDIVPEDWSLVDGIPVASVTRIIADLCATRASFNTLERIFECGNRRGETSRDAILDVVPRLARKGKRGSKKLRAFAAQLLDDGKKNGSYAETLFFQILRDAGLPLPARQKEMMREDGSWAYTDYAYDDVDAVLEILGYESHSKRRDLDSDAERNNDINLEQKTLLEFTWTHLTKDQDYIGRTVRRLLAKHRAAA